MAFCPNKNSKEWERLKNLFPDTAMVIWNKYNGNVPESFYAGKETKPSNKKSSDIASVFESNPELANAVYEALGFKTDRSLDIRNSIIKAYKDKTTINLPTTLIEDLLEFDRTKDDYGYTDKKEIGRKNIDKLKESIKKEGLKEPVELVINSQGAVVLGEGNHRFQALKELGYKEIPTIVKGRGSKDEYFTEIRKGKQVKLGLNLNKDFNNQITLQQKQQALQLYSQYLDTIFPDSKVKDIVYHGSMINDKNIPISEIEFDLKSTRPIWFTPFKKEALNVWANRLKFKNKFPFVIPAVINTTENYGTTNYYNEIEGKNYSGLTQVSVLPNQIHILGSKQDIEGFKKFTQQQGTVPTSSKPAIKYEGRYREEIGEEATKEVTASLAKMLIDAKAKEDFNIELSIGKGNSKGDLANYFLINSYSDQNGGSISLASAEKMYKAESAYYAAVKEGDQTKIEESKQALKSLSKELGGVKLKRPVSFSDNTNKKIRDVFFDIYDSWNTVKDSKFGNIVKIGWRDLLSEEMRNFGLIIKSSNEDALEFEDDDSVVEKIYGKSSLEYDPADKLTGKVKEILSRVESTTPNFLGFKTYISRDMVYKDILAEVAGSLNFPTMLARIENMVRFKPQYKNLLPLLLNLNAADKAAFRSAFSLTKNNFILHIESQLEGKKSTRIIDPNEKSVERTEVTKWKNNAVETNIAKPRALYISVTTGTKTELKVKESKAKEIVNNFIKVQEAIKTKENITESTGVHPAVEALAKVLWNMSMNIGDDTVFDQTAYNLQRYFNIGVTISENGRRVNKKGIELMAYYVNRPNHELLKLVQKVAKVKMKGLTVESYLGIVSNPVNIFGTGGEQKTIRHLASITPLFKSVAGTSFTNGMLKAVYDTNTPTTLDYVLNTLKSGTTEASKLLDMYMGDPFMNPDPLINNKYTSVLLRLLQNPEFVQEFKSVIFDSTKREKDYTSYAEYKNFRKGQSLLTRINNYVNNGNSIYFLGQVPTQADRGRLDFTTFVRSKALTNKLGIQLSKEEIIKGLIIQDLARIAKAKADLKNASVSDLSEGYHYTISTDSRTNTKTIVEKDANGKLTGRAFKDEFMQIDAKLDGAQIVTDREIPAESEKENALYASGVRQMSDMVFEYMDGTLRSIDPLSYGLFEKALEDMTSKTMTYFVNEAQSVKESIVKFNIQESLALKEMDTLGGFENVIKEFVFDDFLARAESVKIFRGSRAYSKNLVDFYKRMSALTTPKASLTLKGEVGVMEGVEGEYGMFPTYNSAVIRDHYLTNNENEISRKVQKARALGEGVTKSLLFAGMDPVAAQKFGAKIQSSYDPTISEIVGTDGMGFISIDMYRAFKQGKGQWYKTHEAAYKEYKLAQKEGRPAIFAWQEGFTPVGSKAGDRILVEPIKPYYEALRSKNKSMVPVSEKNSWHVLLEESTKSSSVMNDLRQRMELTGDYADKGLNPIHVVNTESVRKFSKSAVYQVQGVKGEFNQLFGETLDSKGLGTAQDITNLEKQKVIINRQVKKNGIANVNRRGTYTLNAGLSSETDLTGQELLDLYHEAVDIIAEVSIKNLIKELNIPNFQEILKIEDSTERFNAEFNARLEALKTIRKTLQRETLERGLPSTYDAALNIVVDEISGMPRFQIPLDFPVFQNKFQQIIFGMFNNQVFKQKALGMEAVQFSDFGGSEESSELEFLTVKTDRKGRPRLAHIEVMIREDIARKFGIEPGEDLDAAAIPEELRRLVGYRIPNSDKPMIALLKIKGFLPANYAKAVKVPGEITRLMGSDFDIDKLLIMASFLKNTENGLVKESADYATAISNKSLKSVVPTTNEGLRMATNFVIDSIEAVMSNPAHMAEVATPLDESTLSGFVASVLSRNPNMVSDIRFANTLVESEITERNMVGNSLKGLWNVALGGRNVLSSGIVHATPEFTIKLDNKKYELLLEKAGDEVSEVDKNVPTSSMIGRYISAAVDAGKNPKQIELNDNSLTMPVHNYWIQFTGDDKACVDFLNQPIIRRFVDLFYDKFEGDLSNMSKAYVAVMKEFEASPVSDFNKYTMINMNRAELEIIDPAKVKKINQEIYMNNFMKLYAAGSDLMNLTSIVTPDSIDGMNSISSVEAYKDTREIFNLESGSQAFRGRDKLESPVDQFLGEESVYGTERTYDKMSDAAMQIASFYFPANISESIKTFKDLLKLNIGKSSLTEEQHRDVSRNLMLRTLITPRMAAINAIGDMVEEASPLEDFFSKEHIMNTYVSKETNIAKQLEDIKSKYPSLVSNKIVNNLSRDEGNDDPDALVYTIKFDNSYNYTQGEKNVFISDLKKLMYLPEIYANNPNSKEEIEEIRRFGEDIAAHALISRGFDLGASSFIDLVPEDFWLKPRRIRYGNNAGSMTKSSPVEFFMKKSTELGKGNGMLDQLHDFIRSKGKMRHGFRNLLKVKKVNSMKDTMNLAGENSTYIVIFDKNSKESGIFMKTSNNFAGASYTRLQELGIPKKVEEVFGESAIHRSNLKHTPISLGGIIMVKDSIEEFDDEADNDEIQCE